MNIWQPCFIPFKGFVNCGMSNEELIQLSDSLKAETEFQATHFKPVLQAEEGKIMVRANRKGLMYAAGELLYAAGVLESGGEMRPQRRLHSLDWEELAEVGQWPIDHIELVDEKGGDLEIEVVGLSIKDRLKGWGLAVVAIGLLVAMIVGFITMFEWIFK